MCVSQLVERHDTIGKCIVKQVEYSKMPKDGDWKSVVYECKLKNGMKV
jgi:hypothetical protein